ncbi:hypothetical protein TanjilG_27666 [Lupinus angustifolius]|uniref:Methyltransferase n=1 Tax=Lupinus angustifolius TaxID=3871 RepID=A0A4P1RHF2_LUPAN|nr:hypothetical protein TanjilG_27666 [Lupinus angustifolius]
MAMKHKDGKPINLPNKNRNVTLAITVFVLCGLSFYLGGMQCNSQNDGVVTNTIEKSLDLPKRTLRSLQVRPINFPECSIGLQEYTPCTDPKRWRNYGTYRLTLLERHCPPLPERKECLVEGEKFLFPGVGTTFPNGVGEYVDLMQNLIPEMGDGTVRTAIDTGCGVASWGGDLLDRDSNSFTCSKR